MMQDVFIEYMVRKRRTPVTAILKLLIGISGVLVCLIAFTAAPLLGPLSFLGVLLAFGALYGAYILITGMNIEFEYSLTNGDMDIDKIVAQRRRKRLMTIRVRDVEDFGRYQPQEHDDKAYKTKILACDHPLADDLWFFTVHHREKGNTLVVFNVSDRMLEGIKPFLPRPIYHKTFRVGNE